MLQPHDVLLVWAGLMLPTVLGLLSALLAIPEDYTSARARRYTAALAIALLLVWGAGVRELRAEPDRPQSQPFMDPCGWIDGWAWYVAGCWIP